MEWKKPQLAILVALILIVASGQIWTVDRVLTALQILGWNILAIATLAYLYDKQGRQELIDSIGGFLRVSEGVVKSGIQIATLEYNAIEWKRMLSGAKRLDLCVGYATTWRSVHQKQIQHILSDKSSRVRVLLPDYGDVVVVQALSNRFNGMDPSRIIENIKEAAKFFVDIDRAGGKKASGRLEIRYTRQVSTYAYYRIDKSAVVTMYHSMGKTGDVATLALAEGGDFFEYFARDFDALWANANVEVSS